MYASSWFLTLFTTALNLNAVCCRIMDVFLSEGMEIIFKIALALLTIGKETLLSLDMEAMLKYFQKELPQKVEGDVEGMFNLAYSIKINTKKMKKMEKDYAELRKKEQEEMVELRVNEITFINFKCIVNGIIFSNFSVCETKTDY